MCRDCAYWDTGDLKTIVIDGKEVMVAHCECDDCPLTREDFSCGYDTIMCALRNLLNCSSDGL